MTTKTTGYSRPLDILLVDTDETTLALLAAALNFFGHSARTAASGDEALRDAMQRAPDVLVATMGLGGDWTAPELARCLRRRESLERSIFIVYAPPMGDLDVGIYAYIDHVLQKPIDVHALVEVLEKYAPRGGRRQR